MFYAVSIDPLLWQLPMTMFHGYIETIGLRSFGLQTRGTNDKHEITTPDCMSREAWS
jgi:hypothetical protein